MVQIWSSEKMVLMLNYKSKEANIITYSNRHTIKTHVVEISDFCGYVMHESVQ